MIFKKKDKNNGWTLTTLVENGDFDWLARVSKDGLTVGASGSRPDLAAERALRLALRQEKDRETARKMMEKA